MTTGDNSDDGFQKTRSVLGDVTNRRGKRGLLIISSNAGNRSSRGRSKLVDEKEGDSQFMQKVCQGVENIVKEKCGIKCLVNDNDKDKGKRTCVSPRPCSEINSLRGNIVCSISKVPSEFKEPSTFAGSLHIGRSNALVDNVGEVGDASRDSCASSISMPVASESCFAGEEICRNDEGQVTLAVPQNDPQGEEIVAHVCRKDCQDVDTDDFYLGKHGSGECTRLSESQGSGSFKLERCIGLRGDVSSNSSASVDLIKDCSCSFCMKAAYIWSDLHYQDIKGRIAALKKSQKEAGIMVQRSCVDNGIDKHSQGNSQRLSKLESELMGQWRSLFLRMEDVLVSEGNQLEASLVALKDLRENYKTAGDD